MCDKLQVLMCSGHMEEDFMCSEGFVELSQGLLHDRQVLFHCPGPQPWMWLRLLSARSASLPTVVVDVSLESFVAVEWMKNIEAAFLHLMRLRGLGRQRFGHLRT